MSKDQQAEPLKIYDLKERTARFGEAVIRFAQLLPRGPVTNPLISQLVASGTSIGANYCEADEGETRRDFMHKIGICTKEASETCYWLRMIAVADPESKARARLLWQEAKELNLIFAKIFRHKKSAPSNDRSPKQTLPDSRTLS